MFFSVVFWTITILPMILLIRTNDHLYLDIHTHVWYYQYKNIHSQFKLFYSKMTGIVLLY